MCLAKVVVYAPASDYSTFIYRGFYDESEDEPEEATPQDTGDDPDPEEYAVEVRAPCALLCRHLPALFRRHLPTDYLFMCSKSSGDVWCGIIAQIYALRRSVIHDLQDFDPGIDSLTEVYLAFDLQKPLRSTITAWWKEHIMDGHSNQWYSTYMGSDAAQRNRRSHEKVISHHRNFWTEINGSRSWNFRGGA